MSFKSGKKAAQNGTTADSRDFGREQLSLAAGRGCRHGKGLGSSLFSSGILKESIDSSTPSMSKAGAGSGPCSPENPIPSEFCCPNSHFFGGKKAGMHFPHPSAPVPSRWDKSGGHTFLSAPKNISNHSSRTSSGQLQGRGDQGCTTSIAFPSRF